MRHRRRRGVVVGEQADLRDDRQRLRPGRQGDGRAHGRGLCRRGAGLGQSGGRARPGPGADRPGDHPGPSRSGRGQRPGPGGRCTGRRRQGGAGSRPDRPGCAAGIVFWECNEIADGVCSSE